MRYFQFANCSHSLQAQGEVDNIFCAGEKGGAMVGHTEAVVTGTLAGCNVVRHAAGKELIELLDALRGRRFYQPCHRRDEEGRMPRHEIHLLRLRLL